MDNFEQLFAGKTPEERRAIMEQVVGLSGLEEKDELLQEQLAQASALMGQESPVYTNQWAGLLGAIGDVAKTGIAASRQRKLGGERQGIIDEQVKRRAMLADLLGQSGEGAPTSSPFAFEPDVGADGIPAMLRRR